MVTTTTTVSHYKTWIPLIVVIVAETRIQGLPSLPTSPSLSLISGFNNFHSNGYLFDCQGIKLYELRGRINEWLSSKDVEEEEV